MVTILKSEKDIEVVAEAADGKETCELYNELAPDVLLLDLRMPEKDGLQVITELMSHGEPKPRIIVMTTYESEGDADSGREKLRQDKLCFRLASLPSSRNPWPVLSFPSASFRFCSIWLSVEAIKR